MSMFAKDKKTGELAVKKAYAFLKKAGYKPELPKEIQKDHDIVLGDGRKVEVKFDIVMDTTGNLGVEWWHDREDHIEGWGQYCEADILIQFYNMDNAVVVDWHKFKDWVIENKDRLERKDSKYSKADVFLVPIELIPDEVKIPEIGRLFSYDYDVDPWELDAIAGKKPKIEVAKSSRSICATCSKAISKNEMRIRAGGRWFHLECAFREHIVSRESLDRLSGFDELTQWQAEHVRRTLDRMQCP